MKTQSSFIRFDVSSWASFHTTAEPPMLVPQSARLWQALAPYRAAKYLAEQKRSAPGANWYAAPVLVK